MSSISQSNRIANVYDWLTGLYTKSMGPFPDISSALYEGKKKSLKQAQYDKHSMILKSINFKPGMKILDIGCGWGPMLNFIKSKGGEPVGLTLSPAQAKYISQRGLKVFLKDWKDLSVQEIGKFDAVVSVESMEHYCNCDEYLAGLQDKIYSDFFKFVSSVLPKGGRLYVQTATWGNPHPKYEDISVRAPKDSAEFIVAQIRNFYDSSGWLPDGIDQIKTNSKGFKFLSSQNMRLDNIQTSEEWKNHINRKVMKNPWLFLQMVPRMLSDRKFRSQLACGWHGSSRKAFERKIFDLQGIVFEKK